MGSSSDYRLSFVIFVIRYRRHLHKPVMVDDILFDLWLVRNEMSRCVLLNDFIFLLHVLVLIRCFIFKKVFVNIKNILFFINISIS